MKKYKPEKGEFHIEDEHKEILLTMDNVMYIGRHINNDGESVNEFNRNQIECSYREVDEGDWGIGCNEYLSTADLKSMADGIRSVIYKQAERFTYSCQDDFFCIELQYDHCSESYSFTAAILDTFLRENHIAITKNSLSYAQLEEYILPFFEWEKQYPTV